MNGYRMTCAAALMAVALAGATAVPVFAAGSSDAAGDILQARAASGCRCAPATPRSPAMRRPMDWSEAGSATGGSCSTGGPWAASPSYDLLGRFGGAAEIEIPLTLEVARHSRWGAAVYPYVGIGAGAFYHKRYRTGADESGFTPGRYLVCGMHVPIRKQGLLGLDVRMATVDKPDANPAFPGPDGDRSKLDDLLVDLKGPSSPDMPLLFAETESKSRTLWSVKLDYSITY